MDVTQVPRLLPQALKMGWDAPFRYVASIVGLASLSGLAMAARPSDTLKEAARWAGLDIARQVNAVADWLLNPARSDLAASVGFVLVGIGLLCVALTAADGDHPGTWRGASTAFIGLSLYLQVRGHPGLELMLAAAAFVGWFLGKLKQDQDAAAIAFLDIVLALFYVILLPLVWAVSRKPLSHDRAGTP